MLGTSNATDSGGGQTGGQANDLSAVNGHGLTPTPGWLFPVLVWRDHTGR